MKNINNIQKAKEIKKEEFYQLDIESQIYLICKFPNLLYRFPNYIYENYDLFYLLIEKTNMLLLWLSVNTLFHQLSTIYICKNTLSLYLLYFQN